MMSAAPAAAPPFGRLRRMGKGRPHGWPAGLSPLQIRGGGCGGRCVPGGAYSRPGPEVKERALAMYTEGSSLSAIGRVLGYSAPAVLGWVKKGARRLKPTAGAQPAQDGGTSSCGGDCLR